MLKLLFRKGFPRNYQNRNGSYVFEIMLNDGTTQKAIVAGIGHDTEVEWEDEKTRMPIPTAMVLGWRETYNCDAARQDMDSYLKNPISIVTKGYLSDAFRRHVESAPCLECRRYFEDKTNSNPQLTSG